MNIAKNYARALFELIEKSPQKGREYLGNLMLVLKRRGHLKLLPRIYSEYRALELAHERAAQQYTSTKEQVQTQALLRLYRRLIA